MNNRDRYRLARFTVSTDIEHATDGRPARPTSPGFEFAICAIVLLCLVFA